MLSKNVSPSQVLLEIRKEYFCLIVCITVGYMVSGSKAEKWNKTIMCPQKQTYFFFPFFFFTHGSFKLNNYNGCALWLQKTEVKTVDGEKFGVSITKGFTKTGREWPASAQAWDPKEGVPRLALLWIKGKGQGTSLRWRLPTPISHVIYRTLTTCLPQVCLLHSPASQRSHDPLTATVLHLPLTPQLTTVWLPPPTAPLKLPFLWSQMNY